MRYLVYLFFLVFLAGCYPKGPKYTSELDLAITNYDESFDFEGMSTYILVDTIFHGDDEEDISRAYDDEILERVEANMNNLGFTRIQTPDSPNGWLNTEADAVITISAWSSTSVNYYGGYYPPYWGPGWGWYYPPGWGFVTTSTFGSILIDMSDPTTYQDEQVGIVWSGLVNGMVDNSSPASIRSRIDTEIDICFSHPPFNN